ncbi:MAG TPA: hypothetical protein VFE05_19315 [Longimicrobiaceae bacterium]|jgi:hypothetical protein|nr:hypothetical protein [Longimicrobiaceae bacterium]
MTAAPDGTTGDGRTPGQDRAGDRRAKDRRRTDRRTPVPWWRKPLALVAYGAVGLGLVLLAFKAMQPDDPGPTNAALVTAPAGGDAPAPPPATTGPAEPAYGSAGFERLTLEGQRAVGKRVRTELFCSAPSTFSINKTAGEVQEAVRSLADREGHVPAAECRWGAQNDERREEMLLIVPPDLARDFAAAPVTTDDFVERRRLVADVEWIGRSETLQLRTGGILRAVVKAAAAPR